MPDNIKKKSVVITGWAPLYDEDGKYYEEKTFAFYNTSVRFSIKTFKCSNVSLSFKFFDGAWHHYKSKGSIDYAKKIAENAARLFENIAIDFYDLDLCLRKTFALRKTNTRIIFPHSDMAYK